MFRKKAYNNNLMVLKGDNRHYLKQKEFFIILFKP